MNATKAVKMLESQGNEVKYNGRYNQIIIKEVRSAGIGQADIPKGWQIGSVFPDGSVYLVQ